MTFNSAFCVCLLFWVNILVIFYVDHTFLTDFCLLSDTLQKYMSAPKMLMESIFSYLSEQPIKMCRISIQGIIEIANVGKNPSDCHLQFFFHSGNTCTVKPVLETTCIK